VVPFHDNLVKPGRIEEKIDEAVYPTESATRPVFVKRSKRLKTGLSRGKAKSCPSIDDFIRKIKQ